MFVVARYSYNRSAQVSGLAAQPTVEGRRLNILFLGTDKLSASGSRADTILLVSLDTKSGEAGVISIPRDTAF